MPISGLRGRVVHEPQADHHVCGPGWVWHEQQEFDPAAAMPDMLPSGYYWQRPSGVPIGTVVQCDCGVTWVCYQRPGYDTGRAIVFATLEWRPETKRERRKRERRKRREEPVMPKGMVAGRGPVPTSPPPKRAGGDPQVTDQGAEARKGGGS